MISNFDHVTIVVEDAEEAMKFFALLGFEHVRSVMISGDVMDEYMGVPGIEAEHITLVIPDAEPRQEIQMLRYVSPTVSEDVGSGDLARTGFNHVCFRVDDLDTAVERLVAAGVELRNEPMVFHDRKLVFTRGPSNVVVELAEWLV